MFYKQLSEHRLKIVLSPKDMADLQISYDTLEVTCPMTRAIVLGLLKQIDKSLSFDKECQTLLIELSPTKPGGCIITYTAVAKIECDSYSRQLFLFADAYVLLSAVIAVFTRYSNLLYKSSLYLYEKKLFLSIQTLDGDLSPAVCLLEEYGTLLPQSTFWDSFAEEHMQVLIEQNAIDCLCTLLNVT